MNNLNTTIEPVASKTLQVANQHGFLSPLGDWETWSFGDFFEAFSQSPKLRTSQQRKQREVLQLPRICSRLRRSPPANAVGVSKSVCYFGFAVWGDTVPAAVLFASLPPGRRLSILPERRFTSGLSQAHENCEIVEFGKYPIPMSIGCWLLAHLHIFQVIPMNLPARIVAGRLPITSLREVATGRQSRPA